MPLDSRFNSLRLDADIPLCNGGGAVLQEPLDEGDIIAVVLINLGGVPLAEAVGADAFFTVIVLMFAIIVIGFVKRSKLIVGKTSSPILSQASTNADELKKYKDLLDSGVISQEEFDAKKKHLLGL